MVNCSLPRQAGIGKVHYEPAYQLQKETTSFKASTIVFLPKVPCSCCLYVEQQRISNNRHLQANYINFLHPYLMQKGRYLHSTHLQRQSMSDTVQIELEIGKLPLSTDIYQVSGGTHLPKQKPVIRISGIQLQ